MSSTASISSDTSVDVSMDDLSAALSNDGPVKILGEIVGATNIVAALIGTDEDSSLKHKKRRLVNAFCQIYWGDKLIHKTSTVQKNNNPIWTATTGSLFSLDPSRSSTSGSLRIEVHDLVKKTNTKLIGYVEIPALDILNGSICNEKRLLYEIRKGREHCLSGTEKANSIFSSAIDVLKNMPGFVSTNLLSNPSFWSKKNDDDDDDDAKSVNSNDIVDAKTVITIGTREIDDNYIFGEIGSLALRFRVASHDDLNFLKAVEKYNSLFHRARRKSDSFHLAGVKRILESKILATIASEKSTEYLDSLNCESLNALIEYRVLGNYFDGSGVKRIRVKPYADPSRPENETKFLSEEEIIQKCFEPSKFWTEAGSGSIRQVRVEILSCEGLPNKDIGKMFGNKTDPLVSLIYEDVLVQTDVIQDCLNPIWLPWTQRAFVFNTMNPLSCLYIGVYNHCHGPFRHEGLGRITVNMREFEPNTIYTLKYNLYNSPMVSSRKVKGKITIRLQILQDQKPISLVSLIHPAQIHVNVKRRKTLLIARHTIQGKYSAETYNMKILRSYIDEFMEYLEMLTFELTSALNSLLFWKGQVQIGSVSVPLYSAALFISTIYVIENLHLVPAYIFFLMGSCMFLQMNRRNKRPSPWNRSKSFWYQLSSCIPWSRVQLKKGVKIKKDEGLEDELKREKMRREELEQDKLLQAKIASVRQELNSMLAALSDFSLHTTEMANAFNPLCKLLPLQLVLGDLMFYLRLLKSICSCDDSQISFFLTVSFFAIGALLTVIPVGKIFHWMCKVTIWVFLGPWMRLIHHKYIQRIEDEKKCIGSKNKMNAVMKDIQEREQKAWLNVRIQQEEILKLKSIRSLRFGRFAVKVPIFNLTRYHDVPLPDSYARPSKASCINITKYIPGQSHHGVMIPEFTKSAALAFKRKKSRQLQLTRLQSAHNAFMDTNHDMIQSSNQLVNAPAHELDELDSFNSNTKLFESDVNRKRIVRFKKSLLIDDSLDQVANEEGFEVIEVQRDEDCRDDSLVYVGHTLKETREEIGSCFYTHKCVSVIEDISSGEEVGATIEPVLSDLTHDLNEDEIQPKS